MENQLFLKIDRFSLRYEYFIYFDVQAYLADRMFIKHKVKVWFDREYTKDGSQYIAIFCHVKKRCVPAFLAAINDLKNSMKICGNPDYELEIRNYLDELRLNQD